MNDDVKPPSGGRRRADVAPDSPSTAEIPLVKRHAALPPETPEPPGAEAVPEGAPPVRHPAPSPAWQTPSSQTEPDPGIRRGHPGKLTTPLGLPAAPATPVASADPTPTSADASAPTSPGRPSRAGRRSASEETGPGSRRSTGRIHPLLVLGVLLPLLTVGTLFLVQPRAETDTAAPPNTSALTQATVLCPSGPGTRTLAGVADAATGGTLTGSGETTVTPGAVAEVTGPVVRGSEGTAVGLVATTLGKGTALTCSPPQFDHWFAGAGAGAVHRSTLTLTNPDAGTAVADISVHGRTGEVAEASDMRGVSVAGKQSVTLELDQRVPVADDLALHVAVSRGRLGVQLTQEFQPIGSTQVARDWATPQLAPAEEVRLIGLGTGKGQRTVSVFNPSDNQARVSFQVISDESEFTPTGVDDLTLAPGQVRSVDLSDLLGDPGATATRGVLVRATQPVVAGLTSVIGQDVVAAVPIVPLTGTAGLPLPAGPQVLLLAGAQESGEVTITTRGANGQVLSEQQVDVASARSFRIKLGTKARWITVDPGATGVGGMVAAGAEQGQALALWPLVTEALAPTVRQALS